MTALVDCGDAVAVARHLEERGWKLDMILLAHHHYDHTAGTARLIRSIPGCHRLQAGGRGAYQTPHCYGE